MRTVETGSPHLPQKLSSGVSAGLDEIYEFRTVATTIKRNGLINAVASSADKHKVLPKLD